MSYGGYQQYGGNPYEGTGQAAPTGQAGYGASNPYASDMPSGGYGASNPYGQDPHQVTHAADISDYDSGANTRPAATQNPHVDYTESQYPGTQGTGGAGTGAMTNAGGAGAGAYETGGASYNQSQGAGMPGQTTIMSNPDYLSRVDGIKHEIRQLTTNIGEIGSIHQRLLNSTTSDTASTAQLNSLVSQTQVLNTRIKDQIKQLETDSAKDRTNQTKSSQIRTLKSNFKSQLEDYQKEEQVYRTRYREQIARQYRIVNPEASDMEVREAADANWGDEGVFQTALKSNRTGAATSVLGSVRARHNDIQQIERTLTELNILFQELAEQVILQEAPVQAIEQQTANVKDDTEAGNKHLEKGVKSARRARKLKWWCFFIIVAIIVILAVVLGAYFGVMAHNNNNNNG